MDLEIFNPLTQTIEFITNGNIGTGRETQEGNYPKIFQLPSGNIFCATKALTALDYTTPYADISADLVPYEKGGNYTAAAGTVRVYNRKAEEGSYKFLPATRRWTRIIDRHCPVA